MAEHWYIVHCNPNCERKAAAEIRRRGFGVHVPRLAVVRRHHRTKQTIIKRRPLMAGYIFMRFKGPENWYALRQCQGVKGVLYVDGHPAHIKGEDVAAIMRAQRAMKHEDKDTRAIRRELRNARQTVANAAKRAKLSGMQPGRYVSAPMTGFERVIARVESITKKGTVKGVVRVDGREIQIEFTDVDNLEVIDGVDEAA